jgi:hypothetical protein
MRAIAFYTAVAAFCVLLPIVLLYALGYKVDYKNLKIYKTGIIHVSSNPAGASVYVNGRLHSELTPMRMEELKPGTYRIEVRREGFYPWEREMQVSPNMVTKADRIILFPVKREMKKVADSEISDFAVSNNGKIYYFTKEGLFKSDPEAETLKKLSGYSDWPRSMIDKKFSPENDKLLYFDSSRVFVVRLDAGKTLPKGADIASVEEVFLSPDPIIDVFWYPGSNYIMTVSEKDIKVIELREGILKRNIVSIYKFNSRPKGVHYDHGSGILYFTDRKLDSATDEDRLLYKLELKDNFFDNMMRMLVKKEPESGYEKR